MSKKLKNKRLTFALTSELDNSLELLARTLGISQSELVFFLLDMNIPKFKKMIKKFLKLKENFEDLPYMNAGQQFKDFESEYGISFMKLMEVYRDK